MKMGSLKDLVAKMPFFGAFTEGVNLDDKEVVKVESMISSMTKKEQEAAESSMKSPSPVARVRSNTG